MYKIREDGPLILKEFPTRSTSQKYCFTLWLNWYLKGNINQRVYLKNILMSFK